jgi:cytochrome c2
MKRRWIAWLAVAVAGACSEDRPRPHVTEALAGDVPSGRLLLRQFGCGQCHRIPGVAAARGDIGPPLDRWARRVYLAGVLPNTPQNLVGWIVAPQAHSPGTTMPDMQVSEGQARDIAAYLYTLQ